MAGVTERAKLGTLVTGVQYRHPGALPKTATTLDVFSGGRAYGEIERTTLGAIHLAPGATDADWMIGLCRDLAGIRQAIFNTSNVHEIEPAVADL